MKIVLDTDWTAIIEQLNAESRPRVWYAVIRYAMYGENPNNLDALENVVFGVVKVAVDKQKAISEVRRVAGVHSGLARNKKD